MEAVMHSCSRAGAATGESACYIVVVGGKTDFPAGLAMAHERLDASYAND